MAYMGTGLKNSLLFTTDRLSKEIDAYKKRAYTNGWLNKKTTLIQKGTVPNNCRRIKCLPITWKILKAQIREIFYFLISCGLFPEEQKGCSKETRGTVDLRYIDLHILNESRIRWKNVVLVWIDDKKAYDMVSQNWMINCLKTYEISDEVYQENHGKPESGIRSKR